MQPVYTSIKPGLVPLILISTITKYSVVIANVRFGSKADIAPSNLDVRF